MKRFLPITIKINIISGDESVITQEFCVTCHSNANEEHSYSDGNVNNDFRDFVFFPYQG